MTTPRPDLMARFANQDHPGLAADPNWYRTAVFYEVLVRAFADADGDGFGDLRGIIGRLDYLQWLGIDCLWLPPFYPSPLRDGGYDVADYLDIDPQYGTPQDFAALIEVAHARGIRVIIDIVMNHTSDQHPWFQASRTDPDGPYGDFYVWRDTDEQYRDARIIFIDTETSNWTFDKVRGQYFWHRFFSHQPDLNFENPAVAEAMLDVARHWLNLGIDGFRLDAVPYLFEEDGTNCENLPRTHEFLARMRAMIEAEYPGRIMLAEANQWPRDVIEYYGTAEAPECHMNFHFPVMPRIFYALRSGQAAPILDILADTPQIPVPGGQWSTFLRNHDELTLEMVTDEERAAMYGWYAPEPRMRANVGIRRRLAPLLGNSRAEIELANALLLSLPGSPCLYYGDEIGMGDNIWLPDRDGVRTPMQWTPEPAAGFSAADPSTFYLPVIDSPGYTPDVVNVEAALADPDSLLHWMRELLSLRQQHPAFGTGDFTPHPADDPAIIAYTRADGNEILLMAANLADTPREATITLPAFATWTTTDLRTGATHAITPDGALPLPYTPRAFHWLKLTLTDG